MSTDILLWFTCQRCFHRWLEKGGTLRVRCAHCGNGFGHVCENA